MSLRALLRTPDGTPLVDIALDDVIAMADGARNVMQGASAGDPRAVEFVHRVRVDAANERLAPEMRACAIVEMHLLHRAMSEAMAREIVET